ncbi:MAG TPA: hypothetical protein VG298_17490 [Acidimicrobiales bacterium]|nr:hypothetical protein [Acidimicrobiales bacterium]
MERPGDLDARLSDPSDPPDPVRPKRGRSAGRRRLPARPDGEDGGAFDLRNSWQVVAGSILIPLGLVFILIAWYGAAHARVVQQQIPYMVSGAFIGLGCMVVGGLLYWGHWLYRIYDQAELHHEEQQKVLEELVRALTGRPLPDAGAAPVDAASPGTGYFATASGTVYHQAGCAVIAHHPDDLRVLGPQGLSGLRPCQICNP